jgi:hypothetical protein
MMTEQERGLIEVESTSRSSATCSDIVLREGETTRLLFRPLLVDNPHDARAAVKGTFVHQRKARGQPWQDVTTAKLSTLKAGEGYSLSLRSEELLRLLGGVTPLYQIHEKHGIPFGEREFVPATPALQELAQLPQEALFQVLEANEALGTTVLARLLQWATENEDAAALVEHLVALRPEALRNLNAAVGIQSLRAALSRWQANLSETEEEFWQGTLSEHSFVLEHVFAWPVSIVKEKAYVGGKVFTNEGGQLVDFLVRNDVTSSAALVEIKTPGTLLLGSEYRDGVRPPSRDLAGSVVQVLTYRNTLQQEYLAVAKRQGASFTTFEPRCVVILGNASTELASLEDRRSFELFRSQFPAVDIITYDELFGKTDKLIHLLEAPPSSPLDPGSDIPF